MIKKTLTLLTLALALGSPAAWAGKAPTNPGQTIAIPTAEDTSISMNYATVSGPQVEDNNEFALGSIRNNHTATFNLQSTEETPYTLTIATASKYSGGTIDIVIKNASNANVFEQKSIQFVNNNSWENFGTVYSYDVPSLPAGNYTMTLSFKKDNGDYCGNISKLGLYKPNKLEVPGSLPLSKWNIIKGFQKQTENGIDHFGYTNAGAEATVEFNVTEQGVYDWKWNINWKGHAGKFRITVQDVASGVNEAIAYWNWDNGELGDYSFVLPGVLTPGKKFCTVKCIEGPNYVCNFRAPTLTKIDTYPAITLTAENLTATEYAGYDYNFNLPKDYSEENVNLNVLYANCTVVAKVGETTYTATSDAKSTAVFSIPAPASNVETIVNIILTPNDGATDESAQKEFSVRLFHIGAPIVTSATINGFAISEEQVASLNSEAHSLSIADIFTNLPEAALSFIDGSTVKATATAKGGNNAEIKLTAGEGADQITYTIELTGIHIYTPASTDKKTEIRWKGKEDIVWNSFSFDEPNLPGDGWDGKQIKFTRNTDYTLTVPANAVVKQIVFWQMGSNYGNPGKLEPVTSEGATIYQPTTSDFRSGYHDLAVNVENHVAGTPIKFHFYEGHQPCAGLDIYYVEVPTIASSDFSDIDGTNNPEIWISVPEAIINACNDNAKEYFTVTLEPQFDDANNEFKDFLPVQNEATVSGNALKINFKSNKGTILAPGKYTATLKFKGIEGVPASETTKTLAIKPSVHSLGLAIRSYDKTTNEPNDVLLNEDNGTLSYEGEINVDPEHVQLVSTTGMPYTNLYVWYKQEAKNSNALVLHARANAELPTRDGWELYTGSFLDMKNNTIKSIQLQQNGEYSSKEYGLQYDDTTVGVEGIEVEGEADGEAVYYDLNGVRVAEPANGIFIKVERNSTKIVIVE